MLKQTIVCHSQPGDAAGRNSIAAERRGEPPLRSLAPLSREEAIAIARVLQELQAALEIALALNDYHLVALIEKAIEEARRVNRDR